MLLCSSGFAQEHSPQVDLDDFDLFTLDGYRLYRYRSPTPLSSEHAVTISTDEVVRMLEQESNIILLDVQPVQWNRVFIQKEPRRNIPGSTWLPNVGLGELDNEWMRYYRSHLVRLTSGDKEAAIIIYCRADCWMSWNALKRASEWGYKKLFWYRDGTDGWIENDLETTLAVPEPFPGKE